MAEDPAFSSSAEWSVGYEVDLTTVFGEKVAGTVFAYSRASNLVAIKHSGSGLRLLKCTYIKSVNSVRKPQGPVDLSLPELSQQQLQAREEQALQDAQVEASKLGVGVTPAGQQLFDTLSKTLPCRWRGTSIVVLNEVEVREPYGPDCAKALHGDQPALDRVRTMVREITAA